MTLWLLGQDQPEMWMVGEGIVAWKESLSLAVKDEISNNKLLEAIREEMICAENL